MNSVSFKDSKHCQFLIYRYSFIKATTDNKIINDKYIPDGSIAIVFNYGGRVTISEGTNCHFLPPVFIVIPAARSLLITVYPPLDTVVVHCRASVFTRFFNYPVNTCRDKLFIDAGWLIPLTLWQKIGETQICSERIELFEEFLRSKYNLFYSPDDIDKMYNRIIMSKGEKQVNRILESIELNPRSVRRLFISRTGINAKILSRIVRVNYLWDCYLKGNKNDFQNMVYTMNYHDQAHLINDFKKITGESPNRFFKRKDSDSALISAKINTRVSEVRPR
jgi:AraC-like DNA-binding protein